MPWIGNHSTRYILFGSLLASGCSGQTNETPMNDPTHSNALIHESSPYLLQHAHNPVDWHAWNPATLAKARKEDKLMLISIGYSTCHWCHVMERESFEDTAVAALMNNHYICIKVDREERPDVDQVYMQAVQMMTGHGGWPLNCIALPDGRPLFGGTYFPRQKWMETLGQMATLWQTERARCEKYAADLAAGLQSASLIPPAADQDIISRRELKTALRTWSATFDPHEGGPNRAPKFPMPVNNRFLLRYSHHTGDEEIRRHVLLTLDKMAYGGLYDQLGGGFSRYSTDIHWKVPHFEKMLYDNAQLISLYSDAYLLTRKELYKDIVYETIEFIRREMTDPDGGFYSALDADSEGEEGKFYVWTETEIDSLLGEDAALFSDAFNVNERGLWEHGRYILLRNENDEILAKRYGITPADLKTTIRSCKARLMAARDKRIRPGLDNKIITGWNALMITACCHAFRSFGDSSFLKMAENANRFIETHLLENGTLYHSTHPVLIGKGAGHERIPAFLDDLTLYAEANLALYESTFREQNLRAARRLAESAMDGYFDPSNGLFRYTPSRGEQLLTRNFETEDNVIPASNSVMAKCLFRLSRYFELPEYETTARTMLATIKRHQVSYPAAFANWNDLALDFIFPFHEIAITGDEAMEKARQLAQNYLPNTVFVASAATSELPLLEDRFVEGKTLIYVCTDKACRLPVESVGKAIELIEK